VDCGRPDPGLCVSIEDVAQSCGEGLRLAGLTVFFTEEAPMAAGERDKLGPEAYGHRRRRSLCELAI
jgi:hypothetical protein